jgi:hypothetical protein
MANIKIANVSSAKRGRPSLPVPPSLIRFFERLKAKEGDTIYRLGGMAGLHMEALKARVVGFDMMPPNFYQLSYKVTKRLGIRVRAINPVSGTIRKERVRLEAEEVERRRLERLERIRIERAKNGLKAAGRPRSYDIEDALCEEIAQISVTNNYSYFKIGKMLLPPTFQTKEEKKAHMALVHAHYRECIRRGMIAG